MVWLKLFKSCTGCQSLRGSSTSCACWFTSRFLDTRRNIPQNFWHQLPIFQVYLHWGASSSHTAHFCHAPFLPHFRMIPDFHRIPNPTFTCDHHQHWVPLQHLSVPLYPWSSHFTPKNVGSLSPYLKQKPAILGEQILVSNMPKQLCYKI